MKTPLPAEIQSALNQVENVADLLASTAIDFPAAKFGGMNVASVIDDLDDVSSAVSWAELENAPAKLNAAARSFRQIFPADSLGWEDAARLNNIAALIEQKKRAAAVISYPAHPPTV